MYQDHLCLSILTDVVMNFLIIRTFDYTSNMLSQMMVMASLIKIKQTSENLMSENSLVGRHVHLLWL